MGERNMKLTEEKTYLRIWVNSELKNMNKHLYIFEQWEGVILDNRGIFNKGIFNITNVSNEEELFNEKSSE